ncbi:MAG TPA: hypothetical protein VMZ71_07990, partial [Gemmataceae bacterium]|nr:hypothetical protein [Gemmataceae bacterium]
MDPILVGGAAVGAAAAVGIAGAAVLRQRGMHRWAVPYLLSARRRRPPPPGRPVHLLLAVCDHYEPMRG